MQKVLEQLVQQYRRFKNSVAAMVLLLALAAVCVFINHLLAFAVIGIAVLYHLLYLRKLQKQYTASFTEMNIKLTLGKDIGADSINTESGGDITAETVEKAELVPFDDRKGSCLLREGLSGEKNGIRICMSDAVLAESFQLVKKGKNRIHYLTGVWISCELDQDTGADWRLLDKDVLPVPIRQNYYNKMNTLKKVESDSLNQNRFILYSGNGSEPEQALMKAITALADYTPGKLAISLKGSTLTIFIRDRILARAVSVKEPPSMEGLKFHPFPEIRYIVRCAEKCQTSVSRHI